MKKLISFALVALLAATSVLFVGGCSLVDEEPDPNTVIARIGEYELTLGDFEAAFDMHATMWSSYGYDVTSDQETRESFQDNVFDLLVGTLCALHQGNELGLFEYTDEQLAELQESIDAELADLLDYHTQSAASEGLTGEELETRINELIEEEAAYFLGAGTTRQQYEDYLVEAITEDYQLNLVKEAFLSDVTVSDEAVQEWYDALLESDMLLVEQDPGSYKDSQEEYEMYVGEEGLYPVLYAPTGYYRVMHIFTTAEEDIDSAYTELSAEIEDIIHECGLLAIEAAGSETPDNAEQMAELLEQYNEKVEERDTLYETHFADARAKIEEAYAALEAGEAFADVMLEYTEDADIIASVVFQQKGMLISEYESSTDWSDDIKERFLELKEGEYSEIFADDDGYHILYFVAREPMGSRPLEEVRSLAVAELLETAKDTEWDTLIETWLNSEELWVDKDAIRVVGVPAADEE
ncbi:MAG: peptidyl-prolyl cis-trans isomerase [Clostridia bacterium]|nr:peptidyl-prolyl cis-trans isomerase [Clostridia bacterium]